MKQISQNEMAVLQGGIVCRPSINNPTGFLYCGNCSLGYFADSVLNGSFVNNLVNNGITFSYCED